MTKYREILRLKSLQKKISWPLNFDMTDSALEELLLLKDKSATKRRMPDFDYIRKELLRNGVNKKFLWVEYCEECRMDGKEPLMYSPFCYYCKRMRKSAGQPCIFNGNPVNKSKLTGREILPTSLNRIQARLQMHGFL